LKDFVNVSKYLGGKRMPEQGEKTRVLLNGDALTTLTSSAHHAVSRVLVLAIVMNAL
jgi:hypothetical protein